MGEPEHLKYLTVNDFFRNAKVTTIAEDARREIQQENSGPITTSEAYRAAGFNGEAWSELGNKVVGAEG